MNQHLRERAGRAVRTRWSALPAKRLDETYIVSALRALCGPDVRVSREALR